VRRMAWKIPKELEKLDPIAVGARLGTPAKAVMSPSTPTPSIEMERMANDRAFLEKSPLDITLREAEKIFRVPRMRFEWYDYMVRSDPELYGAIKAIATKAQNSFQGFVVRLRPGQEEQKMLKALKEELWRFTKKFDIDLLVYDIAVKLVKHGDALYKLDWGAVGLEDIRSLPRRAMTAVEGEEQINETTAQVFEPNIYVFNEKMQHFGDYAAELEMKKYPKEEIAHFGWPTNEEDIDLIGRYTYGVWNPSPLESLAGTLLWKHNIRINDILLRAKIVPREHHKLDLTGYDPAKFPGADHKARMEAAEAAAVAAIERYRDTLKEDVLVDEGYVTSQGVAIDVLESKYSYTQPNDLVAQLNEGIASCLGVSLSELRGVSTSSFSGELLVGSYAGAVAEMVAEMIGIVMIDNIIIPHLEAKYAGRFATYYDNIEVKTTPPLQRDMMQRARTILALKETKLFTPDNLREMLGYDPLTDEEKQEIEEYWPRPDIQKHTTSPEEEEKHEKEREKEETQWRTTPESKEQQQVSQ